MVIDNDYFSKLESELLHPAIPDKVKVLRIGKAIAEIMMDRLPSDENLLFNRYVGNTLTCAFNCALNRRDYHAVMSDLRGVYREFIK